MQAVFIPEIFSKDQFDALDKEGYNEDCWVFYKKASIDIGRLLEWECKYRFFGHHYVSDSNSGYILNEHVVKVWDLTGGILSGTDNTTYIGPMSRIAMFSYLHDNALLNKDLDKIFALTGGDTSLMEDRKKSRHPPSCGWHYYASIGDFFDSFHKLVDEMKNSVKCRIIETVGASRECVEVHICSMPWSSSRDNRVNIDSFLKTAGELDPSNWILLSVDEEAEREIQNCPTLTEFSLPTYSDPTFKYPVQRKRLAIKVQKNECKVFIPIYITKSIFILYVLIEKACNQDPEMKLRCWYVTGTFGDGKSVAIATVAAALSSKRDMYRVAYCPEPHGELISSDWNSFVVGVLKEMAFSFHGDSVLSFIDYCINNQLTILEQIFPVINDFCASNNLRLIIFLDQINRFINSDNFQMLCDIMKDNQSSWSNILFIAVSSMNFRPKPLNRFLCINYGYGLFGGYLQKALAQMEFSSDDLKQKLVDKLGIMPVDVNLRMSIDQEVEKNKLLERYIFEHDDSKIFSGKDIDKRLKKSWIRLRPRLGDFIGRRRQLLERKKFLHIFSLFYVAYWKSTHLTPI